MKILKICTILRSENLGKSKGVSVIFERKQMKTEQKTEDMKF